MHFAELQVSSIVVEPPAIERDLITLGYRVDGSLHRVFIRYEEGLLAHPLFEERSMSAFAATLAAVGVMRYASVLPRQVDLRPIQGDLPAVVIPFLERVIPEEFGEYRFQLEAMDYRCPQFVFDEEQLASRVPERIFTTAEPNRQKVLLASGSGKDSLLCGLLFTRRPSRVRPGDLSVRHLWGPRSPEASF